MSIAFIQSKQDPKSEIVFINGIALGFIHDNPNGKWQLEIIESIWETEETAPPDCQETTRQGIITWILKNITFGEMMEAKERQLHLPDSPEVLINEDERRRAQQAA